MCDKLATKVGNFFFFFFFVFLKTKYDTNKSDLEKIISELDKKST